MPDGDRLPPVEGRRAYWSRRRRGRGARGRCRSSTRARWSEIGATFLGGKLQDVRSIPSPPRSAPRPATRGTTATSSSDPRTPDAPRPRSPGARGERGRTSAPPRAALRSGLVGAKLEIVARSAEDLRDAAGPDLPRRSAAALQREYEETLGKPAQSASIEPLGDAGAIRWAATWIDANFSGAGGAFAVETVIIAVAPEWLLELTAAKVEGGAMADALVGRALSGLEVATGGAAGPDPQADDVPAVIPGRASRASEGRKYRWQSPGSRSPTAVCAAYVGG